MTMAALAVANCSGNDYSVDTSLKTVMGVYNVVLNAVFIDIRICEVINMNNEITITFDNTIQCGQEAVGVPIVMNNEAIGAVVEVNKDFITGSIYADAIPELNCETKQVCSFEIKMMKRCRCVECLHYGVCKHKDQKISIGTKVEDLIHECKDFISDTERNPLTIEELKELPEVVWLEDIDKKEVIAAMPIIFGVEYYGSNTGGFWFHSNENEGFFVATHDYNERWRAWNYKPSYAKRRETPWKKE